MKNNKIVLIIASHPDDEVLGCGGTINKMSTEGHRVHILILGEGLTSRNTKRDMRVFQKKLNQLHKEVGKATKILGAASCEILNYPDNRFDSIDLLDIVKSIEIKKNIIKPDIIFTHHSEDLNIDHRITFQAVLTACRPLKNESVKEIYSFEIASSTEWQTQKPEYMFCPTQYVKLNESNLMKKIMAMEIYSSEKRKYPHPRSPEAIKILAQYRGVNIGVEFAECFEVVRRIK